MPTPHLPSILLLTLGLAASCTAQVGDGDLNDTTPSAPETTNKGSDSTPPVAPEVPTPLLVRSNLYGSYEWLSFEEVEGIAFHQGDIALGEIGDLEVLPASEVPERRAAEPDYVGAIEAATSTRIRAWPGGVIPYAIDADVANPQRILSAVNHWNANTNIQFIPHTVEEAFVRISRSPGRCAANVGYQGLSSSNIYLDDTGCQQAQIVHELGHIVGMYHEQSRPDRDDFIEIRFDNIREGKERNFAIPDGAFGVGPYDVDSIMHYGSHAFSKDRTSATIVGKNGLVVSRFGRDDLSSGDIAATNQYYAGLDADTCVVVDVLTLPDGTPYASGYGAENACRDMCEQWATDTGLSADFGYDPGAGLLYCTLR